MPSGNLDPAVLLGDGNFVRKEVKKLLDSLTEEERKNGYIFNLGHGISQYTSPENVAILRGYDKRILTPFMIVQVAIDLPNIRNLRLSYLSQIQTIPKTDDYRSLGNCKSKKQKM